jgi:hypothetical protein
MGWREGDLLPRADRLPPWPARDIFSHAPISPCQEIILAAFQSLENFLMFRNSKISNSKILSINPGIHEIPL